MEERSGSFLPELPYTNRGVIRQKEELSALIDWCQVTIKEVPLEAVIEKAEVKGGIHGRLEKAKAEIKAKEGDKVPKNKSKELATAL